MPQALDNLRVIEFAYGMAGPWIGRFMAYCGAEVIRVESKKRPDVTRQYIPPWAPELGIQPQLSPWFTDWNAGKRFIALDLTNPKAVELAKRAVAICDVVVENYSTGVMDKLGLGYAALQRVKPDIIMLSTTGYGDSGPYRGYVTWGPNIEALSGMSTLSGFPERDCTVTQYAYPDTISALHGLFAIMCALEYRGRTGKGQYINLSQYEATVGMIGHVMMEYLANGREPQRLGNRSRAAAPHGCYRCQGEDRWCAIAVFTDAEWESFCGVVGRPEWKTDPRFATLSVTAGACRRARPTHRALDGEPHRVRRDGGAASRRGGGRRGAERRRPMAARPPAGGARVLRRNRSRQEGKGRGHRDSARPDRHAGPHARRRRRPRAGQRLRLRRAARDDGGSDTRRCHRRCDRDAMTNAEHGSAQLWIR